MDPLDRTLSMRLDPGWLPSAGMAQQFTGLVEITPEPDDDAKLRLQNTTGGQGFLVQNGLVWVGGNGSAGSILVQNSGIARTIEVDGDAARISLGAPGQAGVLVVQSSERQDYIRLDGDSGVTIGGDGTVGILNLLNQTGPTIQLQGADGNVVLGGNGSDGDLVLQNGAGQNTVTLDGQEGNLLLGGGGVDGDLVLQNAEGRNTIYLDGQDGNAQLGGNGVDGDLVLQNAGGQNTITLDGEKGDLTVAGDVYLTGGDVAEMFAPAGPVEAITPGAVVVLDDLGRIDGCRSPYDPRVAGVVSGAGDRNPALILDRQVIGAQTPAPQPVAVMGKVWCAADAESAPIRVGDLLTTSATFGHAMRATDRVAAFGCVIGKALTPLPAGRGRVLVLVGLG